MANLRARLSANLLLNLVIEIDNVRQCSSGNGTGRRKRPVKNQTEEALKWAEELIKKDRTEN